MAAAPTGLPHRPLAHAPGAAVRLVLSGRPNLWIAAGHRLDCIARRTGTRDGAGSGPQCRPYRLRRSGVAGRMAGRRSDSPRARNPFRVKEKCVKRAHAGSTLMLVALGDKPARRTPRVNTQIASARQTAQPSAKSAKALVKHFVPLDPVRIGRAPLSAPQRSNSAHAVQDSAQAEAVQADADIALDLIASGVTTQPVETVNAVLSTSRDGASINAAAKVLGSTTELRSGSWRLPPSVGRDSSWRLRKTHRTHRPGRQSELDEYDLVNVIRRHAFGAPTPV